MRCISLKAGLVRRGMVRSGDAAVSVTAGPRPAGPREAACGRFAPEDDGDEAHDDDEGVELERVNISYEHYINDLNVNILY